MPKSIAMDPRFPMDYWLVPEKAIPAETLGMARPQLYHPTFSMFWNGPGDTDYHGLDGEKEYRRVAFNHRYHVIYDNNDNGGDGPKETKINVGMNTDPSAATTTVLPLYDRVTDTVIQQEVFVKYSPLLDPFKYMVGKYVVDDPKLRVLPSPPFVGGGSGVAKTAPHPKVAHPMNSSYVDAFFYYLTSMLLHHHGFVHGIDFYGSHLGVQDRFRVNIEEDLEYLADSPFFLANIGKIMTLEHCDQEDLASLTDPEKDGNDGERNGGGYSTLHANGSRAGRRILTIHADDDEKNGGDDGVTELKIDIDEDLNSIPIPNLCIDANTDTNGDLEPNCCAVSVDHLNPSDHYPEMDTETDIGFETDIDINDHGDGDGDNDDDSQENNSDDNDSKHHDGYLATSMADDEASEDDDEDDDEDETVSDEDLDQDEDLDHPAPSPPTAVIYQFPVQAIYLERCTGTFDELLELNVLRPEEIQSALFQIVMILLVYQRAFKFTHNDLHTNNIMYVTTDIEYLWYHYEDYTYRVPTYGRIYKIIDYGRSIYEFRGRRFCSDSFAPGGDGATQYNCEPFLNPHKPRLEPNPSFDLCRLGCSIYDFIAESREDVDADQPSQNTEFDATIRRWCSNDQGRNMLYKSNGQERYPGFHLYKMIARTVHAHTPAAQLDHPWFQAFRLPKNTSQSPAPNEPYMDLRRIPTYHL